MARYEHTKIKEGKVVRGSSRIPYNITSYRTTIYNTIPQTDSDVWVITQHGDRLDNLAFQFYNALCFYLFVSEIFYQIL